jgi:hypothetical protein
MKKLLCAALICAPLSANAMLLELTHSTRIYELGQTVTFTARVDTAQVISNDSAPYAAPIFGAYHIDPALSIGVTQATLAIDGTDVLWATGGQFGLGGDMMTANSYDAWMAGGEGEIRTREGLATLPVFKTGAFNRSATSPRGRALSLFRPRPTSRPPLEIRGVALTWKFNAASL